MSIDFPKFPPLNKDPYQGQTGQFSSDPVMTPKYAKNLGQRDPEFRESMARMFVSISQSGDPDSAKQNFLAGLPEGSTKELAKILIGANAGGSGGTGFIDFLLQRVDEQVQEKVQITETLGDNYVAFFFGQQPPVFTYSGTLFNSKQDDQRLGMMQLYQAILRGTQLARRKALMRLRYDSVIVSGTLMNMNQTLMAENELAIPFSFQLLVKSYYIFEQPDLTTITTKVQTPFASADFLSKGVVAPSNQEVKTLIVQSPTGTISDKAALVSAADSAANPPPATSNIRPGSEP